MGPPFKGKPKGQLLGKGPQGGGFWLFLSSQHSSQPPSPSARLGCVANGGARLLRPHSQMRLMPSVLPKLVMGNWDKMGLISWWEGRG